MNLVTNSFFGLFIKSSIEPVWIILPFINRTILSPKNLASLKSCVTRMTVFFSSLKIFLNPPADHI